MAMKSTVFWDVTSILAEVYQCFGGTYCLHLQGRRQTSNQKEIASRKIVPLNSVLTYVTRYTTEVKGKTIPGTGRRGLQEFETSRLPHFLDNRLTDGGDVSLTPHPPFTPNKIPGTHFC
jgi:hypothetical protein